MKFDIKEMAIAFFLFMISMWIGGYINSILGLQAGGDFFNSLIFSFVPFAAFWIIWQKFGHKAASAI